MAKKIYFFVNQEQGRINVRALEEGQDPRSDFLNGSEITQAEMIEVKTSDECREILEALLTLLDGHEAKRSLGILCEAVARQGIFFPSSRF